MEQVSSLFSNDWIEEYGDTWGSMIVLDPQPHQEHINDKKLCIVYVCIVLGIE